MADDTTGGEQTPDIYEAAPPEWLSKTSRYADLGHHGYYPPRVGQDEDLLSDTNVKNGLILKPTIPAETFSAKAQTIKALKEGDYLPELEEFMNQIFQRRYEDLPDIPASSFRMPSRVTLNDTKREAYFSDLANSEVPLYKLGKSVPHGAKGHELLDLLHSNKVAIPRAVWFLRVFGSNETVGLRNKPNYNPMQYSVDWALIMTSYLKKQLAEIALPSAPRIGLNIKQTFKGIFSETESRERWLSRFSYSLELLRTFYTEGMVDHCTFLSWLVQQMSMANLAQAAFIARLTEEYLDGLVTSRALSRPLIESCLFKLNEIATSSSKDLLGYLEERLVILIRRLFLEAPDSFVSPKMWSSYSEMIRKILTENVLNTNGAEPHVERKILIIRQSMFAKYIDVQRRNRALLLRNLPRRAGAHLRSAVVDVQLLNSISNKTDLRCIPFFYGCNDGKNSEFTQKLDVLLSWAVTPLQYGEHRPYAAVTLLQMWRDKAEEHASRRDAVSPNETFQDHLFDWLDTSKVAAASENFMAVSQLYGELVDKELFSYAKYIQRVIARGEPGLSFNEADGSLHRQFLRSIPLHRSTPALINQRKVTLYGVRAREIPEDGIEKQIRAEVRAAFPELFGGSGSPKYNSILELKSGMATLISASRYEQVRCVSEWLLPILQKSWSSAVDRNDNILRTYCVLIQVMELIKCFRTILNTSTRLLSIANSPDVVVAVTETLRRHTAIWASMNVSGTITQALYISHQNWKSRGIYSRTILPLLLEIDDGQHIDETTRQQIMIDMAHYAQALCPVEDAPEAVPPVLPEILLMAQDLNPDASSALANALWYKYRSSLNWVWTVWDNTIASLRQIPSMMTDPLDRRACALRYAAFLLQVDQHVVGGLDSQALTWCLGSGLNEISALTAESWDVVTVVLLFLCVHGAISTTTLLRGVIYPGWQFGVKANSLSHFQSVAIFVQAANNLCRRLLIGSDEISDGIPPVDLLEAQKLRTRRQDVYREPHFSTLANNLPTLVSLENNEFADLNIRQDAGYLKNQICTSSDFRLGTYRSLDAVRSAFEQSLDSNVISEKLYQSLMSALRLALGDLETDMIPSHPNVAGAMSFLSPWKLAASTITIQFVLKQMESGLKRESSMAASHNELDKFIKRLFLYSMSSEEADFVAEMAKGVGFTVAAKFLNHGLRRITEILQSVTTSEEAQLFSMINKAGEFVKLLSSIMEPFRDDLGSIPRLEQEVQDLLTNSLYIRIQTLEESIREHMDENGYVPNYAITDAIVFLCRLLQFELGFIGTRTTSQKDLGSKLLSLLFQLALFYGGGFSTNTIVFSLLLDTIYYIFDGEIPKTFARHLFDAVSELPTEVKPASFDLFQNCILFDYKNIPITIPSSYCKALKSVLRYITQDPLTSGLVYASRSASGEIQFGQEVHNRPWEWIENIGDAPSIDAKDQLKDDEKLNHVVRNNASVSLSLFAARITGEGINTGLTEEDQNRLLFEDNDLSESVFERDWRESRILTAEESALEKEREDDHGGILSFSVRKPNVIQNSCGQSVRTQSTASSSRIQSPATGRSLATGPREIIDVDDFVAPIAPLKRPISSTGLEEDDDIVLIQGPSESVPPPAKKSKGKTSLKKTK